MILAAHPPHPSSGLRGTPAATFPSEGKAFKRYTPDGGVIFRFAELYFDSEVIFRLAAELYFDSEVIFRLAAELYFASQSEKTEPRGFAALFRKVFEGARGDFFQKVPSETGSQAAISVFQSRPAEE